MEQIPLYRHRPLTGRDVMGRCRKGGFLMSRARVERLDVACIPNGILLIIDPGYLRKYPELLFPGKDDKSKDPRKMRARISFRILRQIAPWRHQSLVIPYP